MIEFKKGERYWLEIEVTDEDKFSKHVYDLLKNTQSNELGFISKTVSWDMNKADKIKKAIEPIKELILRGEI